MEQEKKDSLDNTKKPEKKKRNYNYHSETKAKMSARRAVKTKEKRIKKSRWMKNTTKNEKKWH